MTDKSWLAFQFHLLFVFVSAVLTSFAHAEDWRSQVGPEEAPEKIAPINAPFEMPQLERPVFPVAVFPITDFGAEPGGVVKNTKAINAALEA